MNWAIEYIKNKRILMGGLIVFVLSIIIFNNSYFHHDGYLTPDSAEYLSIAKSLREDNSAFYRVNPQKGDEKKLFSTWPLGYPILIAIFSSIFNSSVFVASKILNVFTIVLLLFLLNFRFKSKAIFFYPLVFTGSFINLISATLSESLFCLVLLSIFFLLESYLYKKILNDFLYSFSLFCLITALALIRYIGIFMFFFIFLCCIIFLIRKNYKAFWIHFIVLTISSGCYLIYLSFNIYYTGEITGISRPSTLNIEFIAFFKSLLAQIIFIYPGFSLNALVLQSALILIWYMIYGKALPKINFKEFNFSLQDSGFLYLFGALFYFIFIFFTGSLTDFKTYNFRFLYPGGLLLSIGIIINLGFIFIQRIYKLLIILSVTSILYNSYLLFKSYNRTGLIYYGKISGILDEVEHIPSKSIIIYTPKHLKYLNNDFIFFDGYSKNNSEQFLENIIESYPDYNIFTFQGDKLFKRLQ